MSFDKNMSWKKIIMYNVIGMFYYLVLTLIGIMIVTFYNHYYPVDMSSLYSSLAVVFIFVLLLFIDTILVLSKKPSPTLIVILIAISPVLILYKLVENTDLIQIDRNTPVKLNKFIPPKIIN